MAAQDFDGSQPRNQDPRQGMTSLCASDAAFFMNERSVLTGQLLLGGERVSSDHDALDRCNEVLSATSCEVERAAVVRARRRLAREPCPAKNKIKSISLEGEKGQEGSCDHVDRTRAQEHC